MKRKNKVLGLGHVKFEMPILLPMVVYVLGYIRLEFRQVYAGVLTLGLISKQGASNTVQLDDPS